MLDILGLSGSTRRDSTNTALLRALGDLLPEGARLTLHDHRDVPLFDADLDHVPEPVQRLRDAITASHAVLVVTPEYNHSVPGGLKNALDWASRPAFRSPLAGKPVGVASASASVVGGARAQQHLKAILASMLAPVFPWPELAVGQAQAKLEGDAIVDEHTRDLAARYAAGFVAWVREPHR